MDGVTVAHGRGLEASGAAVVVVTGGWVEVEVTISIDGEDVGEVVNRGVLNGVAVAHGRGLDVHWLPGGGVGSIQGLHVVDGGVLNGVSVAHGGVLEVVVDR